MPTGCSENPEQPFLFYGLSNKSLYYLKISLVRIQLFFKTLFRNLDKVSGSTPAKEAISLDEKD